MGFISDHKITKINDNSVIILTPVEDTSLRKTKSNIKTDIIIIPIETIMTLMISIGFGKLNIIASLQ